MLNWLRALRVKTLTAAIVPVFVGTCVAVADGYEVDVVLGLLALFSALFIQIGTNLVNDALDFQKGADTKNRIGPVRVTQSGLLSFRSVIGGAGACFFLAILLGIPLVVRGGEVIVIIGLISLLCGYAYTGGPFPLAYKGLGDLFVILFFGIVAVGGVYYLHTLTFHGSALVAGLQVGFLATVLIAINNLRDIKEDRLAYKKTLAVRFGQDWVCFEILLLNILSFILLGFWAVRGDWLAALLPLLTLPLCGSLLREIKRAPPGPIYNQYLSKASVVHVVFGFYLCLGLLL